MCLCWGTPMRMCGGSRLMCPPQSLSHPIYCKRALYSSLSSLIHLAGWVPQGLPVSACPVLGYRYVL